MNLMKKAMTKKGSDKKELLRKKVAAAEAASREAKEAAAKAELLAKEVKDLTAQVNVTLPVEAIKEKQPKEVAKVEDESTSSSESSSSDTDEADTKMADDTPVKTVNKEDDDDDSDDSSDDEEDEEEKEKHGKMPVEEQKKIEKEESDSDSSESDSDDSSTESGKAKDAAKEKTVPGTKQVNKETGEKKSSDSSDDSSSVSSSEDSVDNDNAMEEASKKPEIAKEESNGKRKAEESVEERTPKKAAFSGDTDDNRKIYIRGLPWKADEQQVRDFFNPCGVITSCELPLMNDGRSSGTAVIEFESPDGAAAAMELNGNDFDGRWLSIKYSSPKPILSAREPTQKQAGCVTVFVGNLSWDIDEDALREAFGECGEIVSVRFATDRESGEFKGFGHIEFAETEATDKALEMVGTDIMGRQVRVDYANDKRQHNGGSRDGGRGGGRGGRGGGRGFGGRGGGRGGGGGGRGRGGATPLKTKTGAIAAFAGNKITFD